MQIEKLMFLILQKHIGCKLGILTISLLNRVAFKWKGFREVLTSYIFSWSKLRERAQENFNSRGIHSIDFVRHFITKLNRCLRKLLLSDCS